MKLSQLHILLTLFTVKITDTQISPIIESTKRTSPSRQLPADANWRRSGVFIVNFEHISHLCSSVSIVNFEHVIASWAHDFVSLRTIESKIKSSPPRAMHYPKQSLYR